MTEAAGPHLQSLSAHFFKCALLCVCVMHTKAHSVWARCQPCYISSFSKRHPSRWRQAWSHTMWQELLPLTVLLSERISFAFNPTLSFIHASAGLLSPRPNRPPPGRLTLLHSICILFLGPLISPWSFILVLFLISLYLPPSSCSPSSETMAPLRASRYASQSYDDNPVTLLQVNAQQREGERGGACGGRVCTFNSLRSKFDQVKLV